MKLTLRTALSFAAAALAGGALLMSCQDKNEITEEPVQLAAPELAAVDVTTSSFMVIWDAVENADSYVYTLNGGEEESTTYTSAEFTELSSGNYTVKVKAVSEDPAFLDSEWATIDVTVKEPGQLDAPVLKVKDQTQTSFTVTWDAIENAGSYAYTLNGGAEQTTESTSAEFTSLAPGKYTVKVKAVAADENFKDSGWGSVEVTIEEPKPLDAPELSVANKTYTSFTVTWSAVTNADAYTYTLDDGEEMTTASTSIEFKDLSAGDYTVKVKATSKNEAYLDSDWASITVTLEEPVEESFTLDVYLMEYEGYTKYNSFWYTIKGSGVSAVKYVCFQDTGWTDEQMESYMESASEGDVNVFNPNDITEINTTGLSSGFIQLTPETTYEINFYVTFMSGKSELYREKITTEAAPAPSADLAQWLGTWNISSSQSFAWGADGEFVAPQLSNTQKSGTITISADPSTQNGVIIEGWSGIAQMRDIGWDTAYGIIEEGNLVLYNNVVLAQASETQVIGWYAYSIIDNESYGYVNGDYPGYTLSLNGNTATGTPYSGILSDDRPFNVISYDIYALTNTGSGYSIGVYHQTGDASYAGTITLTKQTTSKPMVYKAQKQPSVRSYSHYKVAFPSTTSFSAR